MKFKLSKSSEGRFFSETIEINTLEEFLQFVEVKYKEHDEEIKKQKYLFDKFGGIVLEKDGEEWEITLYDTYLE